jgi:hypothetical protein
MRCETNINLFTGNIDTNTKIVKINIPSDTLNYIENHYGMDWRTPKYLGKTYDYRSSPVSIVRD